MSCDLRRAKRESAKAKIRLAETAVAKMRDQLIQLQFDNCGERGKAKLFAFPFLRLLGATKHLHFFACVQRDLHVLAAGQKD